MEESSNLDDTLVVFTSDHGEQLGDHWMFSKTSYYEQTFHIPLIIYDPDAPKAVRAMEMAGDALARRSAAES